MWFHSPSWSSQLLCVVCVFVRMNEVNSGAWTLTAALGTVQQRRGRMGA